MRIPLKQIGQSGATSGQAPLWNNTSGQWEAGDVNQRGGISNGNRNMTASATTSDGDVGCSTGLAIDLTAWLAVTVNGSVANVGDGVKTKDCYFSGDGGTTARAFGALQSGDLLYWNGSIAGYQLTISDRIDYIFDLESGAGGGGGGDLSMAAFGSTPNNDGGTISGGTLTLQPADETHPGGVSTGTQAFGGLKSLGGVVFRSVTSPSVSDAQTIKLNYDFAQPESLFISVNGGDYNPVLSHANHTQTGLHAYTGELVELVDGSEQLTVQYGNYNTIPLSGTGPLSLTSEPVINNSNNSTQFCTCRLFCLVTGGLTIPHGGSSGFVLRGATSVTLAKGDSIELYFVPGTGENVWYEVGRSVA